MRLGVFARNCLFLPQNLIIENAKMPLRRALIPNLKAKIENATNRNPNRQSKIENALPLPMAYHRERQGQVAAFAVSLHLQIPVARVILGDGGKTAAGRPARPPGIRDGACRKPARLNFTMSSNDRVLSGSCVGGDGRQNESVAIRIHAHMVAVLGDEAVAQGVKAGLDGLTAKIRGRIGKVQHAQESSLGQRPKQDVR